jgi:hypothetical protein
MSPTNHEQAQLVAALTFLASPLETRIAVFESLPEVAEYHDEDGEATTLRPAEALLRACAVVFDRHSWATKGELNQLLGELYCAIQMALVIGENVIDYHYLIDKSKSPVSGPFDGIWAIMSRLAREALRISGASSEANSIDARLLVAAGKLRLPNSK